MIAGVVHLALLAATVVVSVIFIYVCYRHRDKRGVGALAVMFVGVTIWVFSDIIQILTGPEPTLGMTLRLLGVSITNIGILFLGLDYTGRERYINPKTVGALCIEPAIVIGLTLSPYQHLLFETAQSTASPWGYELVPTLLWLLHTVYSYLLVFGGLGLLAHMMWRAEYGYRRQIFAMMFAIFIPFFGNALFNTGISPYDLTPISFFGTAIVLMYAIFRLRLFDAIPIARRTVFEEMDDMVFLLDERGRISTMNDAAAGMFGAERELTGEPIETVIAEDGLADPETGERNWEVIIERNGEERHIDVDKSVLTDYRGNILGQLLVCRDVTDQRRRKEQLELLKDVQSRFLRHNLRNELSTILSNAYLMKQREGTKEAEHHTKVKETVDRLVQWSEKARTIEQLVETTDRVHVPVCTRVSGLVEEMVEEYPEIEFETDLGEEAWILAVPQIDNAIENLLDNAARYNSADQPYVRVSSEVTERAVTLRIEDNGPGIDHDELKAIESEAETQLQHVSGIGLWLAYWVVRESGGDISFDSEGGTTVTLTFETVDPPEQE